MKPYEKALIAKSALDLKRREKNIQIVLQVNECVKKEKISVTEACRKYDMPVDKYYRYKKKI